MFELSQGAVLAPWEASSESLPHNRKNGYGERPKNNHNP
jgi:hypothetical protein|tara:strand:- start:96457 stop:96573 length:117 start_codon:yes stop_codon:yes gene_type:complete